MPDEPGRFKLAALASGVDCFGYKKYSMAPMVVGWFCDRELVAETDAAGKIVDVAVAYPADRADGSSALKGPAGRLVRHLDEVLERGTLAEQHWLTASKHDFMEMMCGLASADQPRVDRAVRLLAAIDPLWPAVVTTLRDRLETFAVTELAKVDHDPFPQKLTSLFAAMMSGTKKITDRK